MVGIGHVGSTTPRGTVVFRSVMRPGIVVVGSTTVVVVDVLEVVVDVDELVDVSVEPGIVVAPSAVPGDSGTTTVVSATMSLRQSVPGR